MIKRFHIEGVGPCPAAKRIVFVDGAADGAFRDGVDLELSHWIPNRTPAHLKADTSTEICMNALVQGDVDPYDLAINNHADVDGILSVFTLLHPDLALRHRATIVEAAEIGDFYGWGSLPARELFQAVALLLVRLRSEGLDGQTIYAQCMERSRAVLMGQHYGECEPGLASIDRCTTLIESGTIQRAPFGNRFVHFSISRALADSGLAACLHSPAFCRPYSTDSLLPIHARAKTDEQRVQLVSVETAEGWYYDLFYPGYAWADVVKRWRPPGLVDSLNSNQHLLDHPALTEGVEALKSLDRSPGNWALLQEMAIFSSTIGRPFPIVLSHMLDGVSAPCNLSPDTVAPILAQGFATP